MFGLDEEIAGLGGGDAVTLILVVAVLLGLRHATDPDHLTAVSALIAGDRNRHTRKAGILGLSWGFGHATTLIMLGLPIVLFDEFLPDQVLQGAEVAVGVMIIVLAVRLLVRWRGGYFHSHEHTHAGMAHRHLHSHAPARTTDPHAHSHPQLLGRSPEQAYGIGLIHGVGGSAGVGIILLAAIDDQATGAVALVLFAVFTALSMAVASTAFGYVITRGPVARGFARLAPALAFVSALFGAWYVLGALEVVPYYF